MSDTANPTDTDPADEPASPDFEAGMLVVDRDQDPEERDAAVVMSLPPVPASEWEVREIGKTVAETNPEYPDDAQTVIVVFRPRLEETDVPDEIREKLREGSDITIAETADLAKFYAFPAPRLKPTGERWPGDDVETDEGDESDDVDEPGAVEPEADDRREDEADAGEDKADETNEANEGQAENEDKADDSDAGVELGRLATVMRTAGFDDVHQAGAYVEATKMGETYRVDRHGDVVEGGVLADKLQEVIEERYIEENEQ